MGLWTTIKGWLNIGGVKVLLWKYTESPQKSRPVIEGAILLKSQSDQSVSSVSVSFIEEFTKGTGAEQNTETRTLGRIGFPEHNGGLGYPLELKAGENKEQLFTLPIALSDQLQVSSGGVVGTFGKLAALAKSEKTEYFLVAEAKVKGTAFNPSHKVKIKVVP
jgi:hypothetical protein